MLKFSLRTNADPPDQTSFLEIYHSPSRQDNEEKNIETAIPSYNLPVFIKLQKSHTILRLCVAFIAVILSIFPGLVTEIIQDTELVRTIALIGLILSFVDFRRYLKRFGL